ncbi:MAG: agmatinase [Bacillota bacterium]
MEKCSFLETVMQNGVKNTFLKLDYVPFDDESFKDCKADFAVLGAAFEQCCVYRPGSGFGPQSIRIASEQFSTYNIEMDVEITDKVKIVDAGDVAIVPGNRDKSHDRIEEAVANIYKNGAIPVMMGGDHSVTLPAVKGILQTFEGKLGIIHFDTHMDTADEYAGEKISNCTQMLRIAEMEQVNGNNIVQIGIRGCLNPKEELLLAQKAGIHTLLINEVLQNGIDAVVEKAIKLASDGTDGIYLTVDIDVLDPIYAPGTCAPSPGGLSIRELIDSVRRIGKEKIVGFDLVEVAPQYDLGGVTQRCAVAVMLEFLSAAALRK